MTGSASPYELEQPIPVIPLPSDVTHPSLSWAPVPRLYNATGKPPIFPMTSSRYLIESRTPASNSSTGLPPVVATETYTSQPSSVSTSDITPPSNQVDSTPPSTPEGPTESWAGGTQAISDFHPTNPSLPVTLTAVELAETLTSMAHVASPSSDRQTGSVSKRCTTALQNPSLVLAPIRSSESSVGPFSTSNVGSVSSVGSTSIGPTLIPLDPSLSITPTTPTKNLHNEAVFPASHSASASDMTLEPSSSAFSWTSINFDEFPEMNPRVSTATGSHPPVADLERQTNMKRKRTISGHDSSSSVKPKKGKFNRLMNEFKTKVTEKQGSPHMSQERRIAMRRKTLHSTPNWLSLKNNLKSIFVPPHFPTVLPLSLLIKLLGTEVLGFLNAFRFASHSADPRHPNRLHQALRKSSPKGFIFLHTAPGVPSRPGQAVLLLSVRSQAHCGSISPVLGRGGEDGVVYFGHYLPQWKRHLEAGEFERLGRDVGVS
ncbi:hypothetical protein JAAARDRAFT_576342 [Jaapia argillacea MUCL 33604]|uniref:Uncharacterized protein n=1 Tax=Jaapia argillacea MUCL 33604 TaxID=933084 RepID=A0A067Q2F1_9AGAM|nr:hypothetical protein JAAARDRAFT_576342 [Jaapia argillacea MUCL 33604]